MVWRHDALLPSLCVAVGGMGWAAAGHAGDRRSKSPPCRIESVHRFQLGRCCKASNQNTMPTQTAWTSCPSLVTQPVPRDPGSSSTLQRFLSPLPRARTGAARLTSGMPSARATMPWRYLHYIALWCFDFPISLHMMQLSCLGCPASCCTSSLGLHSPARAERAGGEGSQGSFGSFRRQVSYFMSMKAL